MLLKDAVPRLVMLWASSQLSVSPLEFLSRQERSAGRCPPEDVRNLGLSTPLQAPSFSFHLSFGSGSPLELQTCVAAQVPLPQAVAAAGL